MIFLDCPLEILHKKGEYILCIEIGRFFFFLGGDTMFYVSFLISCSTCDTLVLIYIMRLFMVYVFLFSIV